MIYNFLVTSDENREFKRVIEIDSDAMFADLCEAILDACGYTKDYITTFYVCDEDWEIETEISQEEQMTQADEDSYIMSETRLEEFVTEKNQKLVFVFDMISNRCLNIILKDKTKGTLREAKCAESKGKAPKQIMDVDLSIEALGNTDNFKMDDDFGFDEDGFNDDELDDLNIDDNYFENRR